jgi:hypothetical protein
MADNFNYKQFLMENRLGAYSKANLNEGFDDDDAKELGFMMQQQGDVEDAPPTIEKPRDPKEVAAAVKSEIESAGQSLMKMTQGQVEKIATDLMVAALQAQGSKRAEAETTAHMLLGATNPTYPEFRQEFYDALLKGEVKEAQLKLDQDGAQVSEAIEEGSSSALDSLNNIEGMLLNLKKNVATDSTIGTDSKQGLLQAFAEMMEHLQTIGYELEVDNDPGYTSDYMKRRASEN